MLTSCPAVGPQAASGTLLLIVHHVIAPKTDLPGLLARHGVHTSKLLCTPSPPVSRAPNYVALVTAQIQRLGQKREIALGWKHVFSAPQPPRARAGH